MATAEDAFVDDPTQPSVFAWLPPAGSKSILIRLNTVAYHSDGTVAPTPDGIFIRGFGPQQKYVPTSATRSGDVTTITGTGPYGTTTADFETTVDNATGTVTWKNTPVGFPVVTGSAPIPAKNVYVVFPA